MTVTETIVGRDVAGLPAGAEIVMYVLEHGHIISGDFGEDRTRVRRVKVCWPAISLRSLEIPSGFAPPVGRFAGGCVSTSPRDLVLQAGF